MNSKLSRFVPSSFVGLAVAAGTIDIVPMTWPVWLWLGLAAVLGLLAGIKVGRKLDPPAPQEWNVLWIVSVIALALGLTLGVISWVETDASWPRIFWISLPCMALGWWVTHWVQLRRRQVPAREVSDSEESEASIDQDLTDTTEFPAVQQSSYESSGNWGDTPVTIGRVTTLHPMLRRSLLGKAVDLALENDEFPELYSETVFPAAASYHWWKLVMSVYIPVGVASFFAWGALDYSGFQSLIESLSNSYRLWGLVLVIVFAIWRIKVTNSWRRFFRRTTPYSIGVVFGIWWWSGFPGAAWLRESFATGSPQPYLLGMGLAILWALYESTEYFYGFVFVSHFRVVLGKKAPRPIPNSPADLELADVNTTKVLESLFGNLLGMIGRFFGRDWAFCYVKWDAPSSGDEQFHKAGPFRFSDAYVLHSQSRNAQIQLRQGVHRMADSALPSETEETDLPRQPA